MSSATGRFEGYGVLITGAGRGIGEATARRLAAEGARVLVTDVDAERAAKTAEDIVGAESFVCDVGDRAAVEAAVAYAVECFGTLDVLVNNAGILRDNMIFNMTENDFDSVIKVHLKGTFACTHHAAVYWRAQSKAGNQPRAAIVNTVSSAGLQGNVGQANYGSAKAAIAALTIISSLELGRLGVRANAVAPGGMTRMSGAIIKDMELKEPDEYTEFNPMNPGNSAPMVAWLASDEALHVTGQVFRAVGSTISRYQPWTLQDEIENPAGAEQWDPAHIGAMVNAYAFHSRNPGLQMGKMRAGTK
jgi:NAD(P)-dependent dehydrogenase (short-subunit alcohol dehydrogenase family)